MKSTRLRKPKAQRNMVELKARIEDVDAFRSKLSQCGVEKVSVFHQIDTYYSSPKGRLKLRETENGAQAELIYYERENIAGPKRSSVFILSIPNPRPLKQILNKIMKTATIVDKIREIYAHDGIQIHLDKVKGLGSFIEFESASTQNPDRQRADLAKLEVLRKKLDINLDSLERRSYSDLI